MKPNFALSLSLEGITLLHRAAGGWRRVGSVAVDDSDLPGALSRLRGIAQALEPGGIRSKVLIPNDQIRYMSIETGRLNEDARRDAAAAALAGATPYALDDLAFDISPDGETTHVAAVARETLAEAEAFAVDHQFHPISFVAVPEDQPFLGEPFFGPSAHADQLPGGGQIEPDGIAVVVVGEVELPEQETASEAHDDEGPTRGTDDSAEPAPGVSPSPAGPRGFSSRRTRADRAAPAADNTTAEISAAQVARRLTLGTGGGGQPAAQEAEDEAPTSTAPQGDEAAPGAQAAKGPIAGNHDKPARTGFFSRRKKTPESASDEIAAPPEPILISAPSPVSPRIEDLAPDDETARLTVFGARQPAESGRQPRSLGLILTVALLLFLAAIAAWASVFLDNGVAGLFRWGDQENSRVAVEPQIPAADPPDVAQFEPSRSAPPQREQAAPSPPAPPAAPDSVIASLPAPTAVPLASPDQAESLADEPAPELTDTDSAVLDALSDNAEPAEPDAEPAMDEARAEALYAASGIWQSPPKVPDTPSIIGLDDLYVASIDRTDLSRDAVALPPESDIATDESPAALSSPAAPGTDFDLDDKGLVVATREGALTPEGIVVYLGRPPAVPPDAPVWREVEPTEDSNIVRLAQKRPRLRPADLVESAERVQLGGLSREELGKVRPRARPAKAIVEDERDETATARAVAVAARPKLRPDGFSRIVEAARASQPARSAARTSGAAAPATVTPRIPTSASVARQATIKNAVSLHKVSLIGVYGTSSNRRALVRLPSGRYKKVKVGDSVDGGRVVAIGDSELRYQKGGRNLTLKMPKG